MSTDIKHPVEYIRKKVLRMPQATFAELVGVSQGTVSRWEQGKLSPTRDELMRMREEAQRRGIAWDDSWIFETPVAA